jgi:hypothetical protein
MSAQCSALQCGVACAATDKVDHIDLKEEAKKSEAHRQRKGGEQKSKGTGEAKRSESQRWHAMRSSESQTDVGEEG